MEKSWTWRAPPVKQNHSEVKSFLQEVKGQRKYVSTFRHFLQQAEDGTAPDEGPGLEEVHGRREVRSQDLLLLHFEKASIQQLLLVVQYHLPACLHGGLLLYERLPLPGVWDAQATG